MDIPITSLIGPAAAHYVNDPSERVLVFAGPRSTFWYFWLDRGEFEVTGDGPIVKRHRLSAEARQELLEQHAPQVARTLERCGLPPDFIA